MAIAKVIWSWLKDNKYLIGTVLTCAGGLMTDKMSVVAVVPIVLAALSTGKKAQQ